MEIKELVFEAEFREQFKEFEYLFSQLDILGGKKCKSCDLRKQRNILREVERRIYNNDELKKRFSVSFGVPEVSVGFLSLDNFRKTFISVEVREVFEEFYPEVSSELKNIVAKEGYFSESAEAGYRELYKGYQRNKELFDKYNVVLGNGLKNKLLQKNPQCKIITAETWIELENKINEFIVDKKVESLTVDDLAAIILYRKVG